MRLLRRSTAALLLVLGAGAAAHAVTECQRVVAVGDLHGGFRSFARILEVSGLVDQELRWSAEDGACLVQLGDVVDRGPRSRELLELLMGLQEQAPGRVEVLLGNHEVLNLLGDLRYVAAEEYAEFSADETAAERDVGFEQFRRSRAPDASISAEELRREFDALFPAGWFARRRAFAPEGRYGAWLLERPVAVRIGGTVFVHAGLKPEHVDDGLEALTEHVHREIRDFVEARRQLEAAGWIPSLASYQDSFRRLHERLETLTAAGKPPAGDLALVVAGYVSQLSAAVVAPEGPLWYRGLGTGDAATIGPTIGSLLDRLEAERIVVAHTTSTDGRIVSRFGGRVFAIDTGSGPAYAGRPSALEIAADGTVHAIYLEGREKLADPPRGDAVVEAALAGGRVVETEEIGSGITRPKRVTLEYRGRTHRAAFKTVDIQNTGMTRFEGGTELNFTDNYRYERAAYLLDRMLGIGMVPVVVLRELDGEEGALIAWVEDAIDEAERRESDTAPPDPVAFKHQQDVMLVFDALIANADRNLSNQLITTADGRLHLIDHSRSFRMGGKLPEAFDAGPIGLPRELFDALRALQPKPLRERTKGLLSGAQVKALLARRDRIVEQVRRDLAAYGEAVVFHPAPADLTSAP